MAYTSGIPAVGNAALSDIPLIAANFAALRSWHYGVAEPSGDDLSIGTPWVDSSGPYIKICSGLGPPVTWRILVDFTDAGMPKTHIANTVASDNMVHGVQFGHGNGLDADKLDGKHLTELTPYIKSALAYYNNTGVIPYASNDAETSTTESSLTPVKEMTLNILPSSSLKIYFELKYTGISGTAYAKIYKNNTDSVSATLRSNDTSTYIGYTETLSTFSQGDRIQIYASTDGVLDHCYIRNFRLLGSTMIENTLE